LNVKEESIEERKAEVLIKLRKYKLIKKEEHEDAVAYTVNIPKDKEKALVWCILGQATVGIAMMNALYKLLDEKGLDRAIVITEGRFTHAAKQGAKKRKVELLPKSFPVFELFDHKIQPYQMPQIKSGDPAVKAIGAKPGDMLRIIRKSATAGEHIAYRYVVD
jgi:DNA-directed RNA polymerase subunit H (RpoH/RPB5)